MPGPEKTKRTKAIKKFADANDDMSLTEIGKVFHVSRQRVAEIVGKRPERKDGG